MAASCSQRLREEVDGVDLRFYGGAELCQRQLPYLVEGRLLPHVGGQQRAVQPPVASQSRGHVQCHVGADVDIIHLPDPVGQHPVQVDVVDPEEGRGVGGFVHGLDDVRGDDHHVAVAVRERVVPVAAELVLHHGPLALLAHDGTGVPRPQVAGDGSPRLAEPGEVLLVEEEGVDEHVVVHLKDELRLRAVLVDPAVGQHAFVGQVVVRVLEPPLDEISVHHALHLDQSLGVGAGRQPQHKKEAEVASGHHVLTGPGLADEATTLEVAGRGVHDNENVESTDAATHVRAVDDVG